MRNTRKQSSILLMSMCFLLLVTFVLFVGSTITHACDCVKPPNVEQVVQEKDAIFSGEVLEIYNPKDGAPIQSSADPVYVLMNVHESWKGVETSQAIVVTEASSASCGFSFEIGEDYLVYASAQDEFYRTQLCDRTASLSDVEEDMEILGDGSRDLGTVDYDLQEEVNRNRHDVSSESGQGQTSNEISTLVYVLLFILIGGFAIVFTIIWRKS